MDRLQLLGERIPLELAPVFEILNLPRYAVYYLEPVRVWLFDQLLVSDSVDSLDDWLGSDVRFDLFEALHWFASNYHNGQADPVYQLTSLGFEPGAMSTGPESPDARMLYSVLRAAFLGDDRCMLERGKAGCREECDCPRCNQWEAWAQYFEGSYF